MLFLPFVFLISTILPGQNGNPHMQPFYSGIYAEKNHFFVLSDSLIVDEYYFSVVDKNYHFVKWQAEKCDSNAYLLKCKDLEPFNIIVKENTSYINISPGRQKKLHDSNCVQIELFHIPWTVSTCIYAVGIKVNKTTYKFNPESYLIEILKDTIIKYKAINVVYLPTMQVSKTYDIKDANSNAFFISVPQYDFKINYCKPCEKIESSKIANRKLEVISRDSISIISVIDDYKLYLKRVDENVLNSWLDKNWRW